MAVYALDAPSRRRLSAESSVTDQTIRRYLRGESTNASTVDRLSRAAKALGMTLPPPASPIQAPATGGSGR